MLLESDMEVNISSAVDMLKTGGKMYVPIPALQYCTANCPQNNNLHQIIIKRPNFLLVQEYTTCIVMNVQFLFKKLFIYMVICWMMKMHSDFQH